MSAATLSYDLLCLILQEEDDATLYQCSLVNREFNRAASRILYSKVVFAPAEDKSDALRVSSAALAHNAPYVQVLRIGALSSLPSDFQSKTLLDAVTAFENLNTVELLPEDWRTLTDTYTEDGLLLALSNRGTSLSKLRVNPWCMTETRAPILADIGGLRELALDSPSRAILQLLPDWLGRLSPSLRELHLTGNCGSITPGILRSFAPLLANVTAFSLGLSYSIADDDLFAFLGQLSRLETVQLQHYVQFKPPSEGGAPLASLRSLTVLHHPVYEEDHAARLAAWVCRALFGAPGVECVRLCCSEYEEDAEYAPRGMDALLEHLARAPCAGTLRVLDLGGLLVEAPALALLGGAVGGLEELGIALDADGFDAFLSLVPTMKCLHTARLKVYTVQSQMSAFMITRDDAARIMQNSAALRRLAVNDLRTKGYWVCDKDGDARFEVVELITTKRGPHDQVQSRNPPSMGMIQEEEEEEG